MWFPQWLISAVRLMRVEGEFWSSKTPHEFELYLGWPSYIPDLLDPDKWRRIPKQKMQLRWPRTHWEKSPTWQQLWGGMCRSYGLYGSIDFLDTVERSKHGGQSKTLITPAAASDRSWGSTSTEVMADSDSGLSAQDGSHKASILLSPKGERFEFTAEIKVKMASFVSIVNKLCDPWISVKTRSKYSIYFF